MDKADYTYTRKVIDIGSEQEDNEAWGIIYDTYLKEFGLGKDYERVLELKSEIALLELDLVIEENNFIKNQIKQLKRELTEILDKPIESDMDSVIIGLENWRGISINEHTTTVRKFYKLLREYKKAAEKSK